MSLAAPRTLSQSLLQVADLDGAELDAVLDLAAAMRRHPSGWRHRLEGRAVACILDAPSLAAHAAFASAINRLGALPVLLQPRPVPEEDARELSSTCAAIVVCGASQRTLRELAEHATVPVVNGGGPHHDPCGALACCLALRERFGRLADLSVAYVGAADALAHSLLQAAPLAGFELRLACPSGALADPWIIASAGQAVRVMDDPGDAVTDAHIVVSDSRIESLEHEQARNLAPIAQALLHALTTGDWEISPC